MKEQVAAELAARVKNGQLIGVGTGSTVELAVARIGERVKTEKLDVKVVPTSLQTAWQCQQLGLNVLYQGYRGEIAWGFDGADAVDKNLWLVKGKGGALLQEKILAARCREFLVIVDDSKLVQSLSGVSIPVEIIPSAIHIAERELAKLGARDLALRPAGSGKHGPVITEAGNVIIDVQFSEVASRLEKEIKSIVGVVESGLFIGYASQVLVGGPDSVRVIAAS